MRLTWSASAAARSNGGAEAETAVEPPIKASAVSIEGGTMVGIEALCGHSRRGPNNFGASRQQRQAGNCESLAQSRWKGGKTDTVSDFLGERVGQKTQKQGEVHLTDVCKIRFLMAGTQRL